MSKNQNPKQNEVEPKLRTDSHVDLNVSLFEMGNDNSDATVLFEALELHRDRSLRFLISDEADGQYKAAYGWMREYKRASEMQRKLFNSISRTAFLNSLKFEVKGQPDEFKAKWLDPVVNRSEDEDEEFTLQDYMEAFSSGPNSIKE